MLIRPDQAEGAKGKNVIIGDDRPLTVDNKILAREVITVVDYYDLMMDNIDEVSDKRLQALKEIEKDKLRVARAYNNRISPLALFLALYFLCKSM